VKELTEGVKNDQGKIQVELLSPIWLFGVGQVLSFGAVKYAAHNWRKGIARSRLLGAALRHILAYLGGEDLDPESGLCHLYHASCCLMFASELHFTRPDTDDRYKALTQAPGGVTLTRDGTETRDSLSHGKSNTVFEDLEKLRVFSSPAGGDLGHPGFSPMPAREVRSSGVEIRDGTPICFTGLQPGACF
jgi:hypothetical protein